MLFSANKNLSPIQRVWICIILSALLLSTSQIFPSLFQSLEEQTLNYRFHLRGPEQPEAPIIIVLIDEHSALEYGFLSPTPRKLLTHLVDTLHQKKAKVIGLDFVLDRSHISEDDQRLAQAFEKAKDKIILARPEHTEEETDVTRSQIHAALPMFSQFTSEGYSAVVSGNSDIVYWMKLGIDQGYYSFAEMIYQTFIGHFPYPESPSFLLPINFLGLPSRLDQTAPIFSIIAAKDVTHAPDTLFQDKIVLIGSGIEKLGDIFYTPFLKKEEKLIPMFGVELHAIVLDMLLSQRHLSVPSQWFLVLLSGGFIFLSCLLFFFLRFYGSLLYLATAFFGWLMLALISFQHFGIIIPVVQPIFYLLILFGARQLLINVIQARNSYFIKSTFKRYISPALVDQLIQHPEQLTLGGQTKNVTVFFLGWDGFVDISAHLSPQELVQHLNEYQGFMTEILYAEDGTLEKFQETSFMALFGTPLTQPDHAIRACRTALTIKTNMPEIYRRWGLNNSVHLKIQIGINTEDVIVGNVGSKARFHYTAIGDAVNHTARLEGVNRIFGTEIIISEHTLQQLDQQFVTRQLGCVIVKGRTKPVKIYELVGMNSEIKPQNFYTDLHSLYAEGLHAFNHKNFVEAHHIFTKLTEKYQDPPAHFMLSQSLYFQQEPPDDDWQGEIILQHK